MKTPGERQCFLMSHVNEVNEVMSRSAGFRVTENLIFPVLIHAYVTGKYLNKFAALKPQLTQLGLQPSYIQFTVGSKV